MKFLITGANGQLAKEFIKTLQRVNLPFVALTKKELDITNLSTVIEVVKHVKPNVLINCAAYNLVDLAEKDGLADAFFVNTVGVMNLSYASKLVDAFLVHYSTDYVFDGNKEKPYSEEDIPNPVNIYGKSKLVGEKLIKQVTDKYLILRVSWVYGEGSQNFLYKLTQWAKERDYLRIACDEFSVPTSTTTIVEVSLKAIREGLTGIYHLTNSGYASRYEWAKEYFRLMGINRFIQPAYQSDFNLPAKRPRWSVMSNEKIKRELGIQIQTWQESLERFIKGKE